MILNSSDEVLQELRRRVGHEPNAAVWGMLLDDGWPDEIINDSPDNEAALTGLVKTYMSRLRRLRESENTDVESRLVREARTSLPSWFPAALAELLAFRAAEEPAVRCFREGVLGGSLLQLHEGMAWVEERKRVAEHLVRVAPTLWTQSSFHGAVRYRLPTPNAFTDPEIRGAGDALRDHVAGSFPRIAGVDDVEYELDFFECLSEWLTWAYGWLPTSADRFVLSGDTPVLLPIIGSRSVSQGLAAEEHDQQHQDLQPRRDVYSIQVHSFVSPRDLMEFYSRMRRSGMGETARFRLPMQERASLAVFAAQRNDGRSWEAVMNEWNDTEGVSYRDARKFARDCREAYRQITDFDLAWGGTGIERDRRGRRPKRNRRKP